MREIIFRGKTSKGNWVYGLLNNFKHDDCNAYAISYVDEKGRGFGYEVITETVGQFSGLTDKNEKKIFEGDIVKSKSEKVFSICFDDGAFCFNDNKGYIYALGDSEFGYAYKEVCNELEVIGNVIDNSELLERE